MKNDCISGLINFESSVILITGGAGVLGSHMASALYELGGIVYICDMNEKATKKVVTQISKKSTTGEIYARCLDVLDRKNMEELALELMTNHGKIDYLINAAGGNNSNASTTEDRPFFDLEVSHLRSVIDLNLMGTIIPCQVIGRFMAEKKKGVILNISSMNAFRPLTRIPAYSAAKAAISNFTQWLAVHMAQEYDPSIRVNALAPGFFLTEQNKYLLLEGNELTLRGKRILDHTPMGRFGKPEDLIGTMLWLLSSASSFVSGVVVPVDGGFSAFSGV